VIDADVPAGRVSQQHLAKYDTRPNRDFKNGFAIADRSAQQRGAKGLGLRVPIAVVGRGIIV
jgi:hypothetical protein